MAKPSDLENQIQVLLAEREKCVTNLQRVDGTLLKIRSLLRSDNDGVSPDANRARSSSFSHAITMSSGQTHSIGHTTSVSNTTISSPARRKRQSFITTAEDLVLAFVKAKRNPTTREINAHWKSQGRGHTADNTLVKLVKEKKLKRMPLLGERGSRYALA